MPHPSCLRVEILVGMPKGLKRYYGFGDGPGRSRASTKVKNPTRKTDACGTHNTKNLCALCSEPPALRHPRV